MCLHPLSFQRSLGIGVALGTVPGLLTRPVLFRDFVTAVFTDERDGVLGASAHYRRILDLAFPSDFGDMAVFMTASEGQNLVERS